MKFTFVNQTIFSSSTNLRDLGGQFDGIGKIQFVNKGIADTKASVLAVEEKFKSAFYRQDEEEKFLDNKQDCDNQKQVLHHGSRGLFTE